MTKVTLEVNGKKVSKEVPDHTLLSVFLRDNLNLTGTHVGCDTSQCGACVVHVNGKSIKSCSTLAADIDGSKVTTKEQLYCSIKEDNKIMLLNCDPHSPCDFRGNLVKNFDDFYEVYDVKENDNMYIKKDNRLIMW